MQLVKVGFFTPKKLIHSLLSRRFWVMILKNMIYKYNLTYEPELKTQRSCLAFLLLLKVEQNKQVNYIIISFNRNLKSLILELTQS